MTRNSRALIGAIKAGQNWLGWDDATYRGVLKRLTGKESSTRCSLEELQSVREYMHEQGYPRKTSRSHGRRPSVAAGRQGLLRKIEALLTDAGRKWDYAEAVSLRMFGQKTLEWLTDEQLTKLMQALIIDARRRS
ncbi:hypothetical protein CBW22_07605 [Pantoea sp. VS1]|uniref:gp16 family protein n=1 Tax=Pantoea sp. VS1 TaxID=2003658 RepID=UPI000B5105F9|nr:regulatory protein GemA [Pantoea sp. VS1]OWS76318.1 hypothetical protein CBW22_07605 [Pantoea sp. VS1]